METNIREIPLAGIQIGERTRRVLGDLHALAQDIAEVGLSAAHRRGHRQPAHLWASPAARLSPPWLDQYPRPGARGR